MDLNFGFTHFDIAIRTASMSVVSVTVTKCVVASMSLVTGTVTGAVTVNVTKCVGASMSTLSCNPKVNDESLRGHVEPMPPPPALALAHEVWRANRDGDTAAARDALEKLTALAERRVV